MICPFPCDSSLPKWPHLDPRPGRHPRASPSHPSAQARPGAPRANACAPWWLQRRSSHRLAWNRGFSPRDAGSCWEQSWKTWGSHVFCMTWKIRYFVRWDAKWGIVCVCVEIKLKWFAGWQEAAWSLGVIFVDKSYVIFKLIQTISDCCDYRNMPWHAITSNKESNIYPEHPETTVMRASEEMPFIDSCIYI